MSPSSTKIWMIEVGEPVPLPGAELRLMRAGQICERLAAAGADVTWWVSDFNHPAKRFYDLPDTIEERRSGRLENGIFARFLHGRAYTSNISLARLLHNKDVAADFAARIEAVPRPDLIYCCYPTIELAEAATLYGQKRRVPVILDVRDLWPDIFEMVSPAPKRLTRLALSGYFRAAKAAFSRATGISAISPPILEWALAKAGRSAGPHDYVAPLSYETKPISDDALAAGEEKWHRAGLKLDGSEHIACYFGVLTKLREFETVVGAIEHLPSEVRSRTRFVLCGAGERLDWLKARAQKFPELVIPGFVGAAAIQTLMRRSAAGLVPYPATADYLMSYPNKLSEYLSAGLPVLSTLDGIAGRLLREENCGVVVPNQDPRAFAEAFVRLALDESDWKEKSLAAHRVFSRLFDAEIVYGGVVERLLALARCAS